ncbi:peptidylprolyl isomerase [Celeribacter litoreus]|uniref:peptidylprolyl isomerase n=1 Tax=Celeribacter litoreus TaxID=2876714 RepID=UPI001CCDB718|nr:peptidylprolyl isomerase [Celeribacter litoreus]MCA0042099.1 peptidylprolyl isomerase [Celeribacter litoreus]
MKYRFSAAAVLVSLSFLASSPAVAEDMTASTVVATVNGAEITLGHVIAARQALPPEYQGLDDARLFEGILNQIVQQELLKQAAGDVSERLRLQLENEERVLIAGDKLESIAEQAVTDEALQAAYEARMESFEPAPEFHAAHILVETEEEALELIAELEGGADFAELAKEKSTGPSGPNGGDLGWFGVGMMVQPFEAAVVTMETGDISEPVQTQFGWHVIKMIETRMAEQPTLAEMSEELAAEVQDQAIRDTLTELSETGEVIITEGVDPTALRMDQLLDQ